MAILSDRDIKRRLLKFFDLGLKMSFESALELVKRGEMPGELRQVLEAGVGEGKIIIDPFPTPQQLDSDSEQCIIGSCSLDLRLGHKVWVSVTGGGAMSEVDNAVFEKEYDLSNPDFLDEIQPIEKRLKDGGYLVLEPGRFLIAHTWEKIFLPADISAHIVGRSSFARMGIIGVGAPKIDAGFFGPIALEIPNLSQNRLRISPGLPICQILFLQLSSKAQRPYYLKPDAGRFSGTEGRRA